MGHDDEPPDPMRRMIGVVDEVDLMEVLEAEERKSLHVATQNYYMPMTTCEEEVDVSFLDSSRAADLSDAIACTNVGEVRHTLDRQLKQCMLSELCEDDDGSSNDEEVGASIFAYSSPMGLIPDGSGDYSVRDSTTATWTRFITVPRREFHYPNEGERGLDLSTQY